MKEWTDFMDRVHGAWVEIRLRGGNPNDYSVRLHPAHYERIAAENALSNDYGYGINTIYGVPLVRDSSLADGDVVLRHEVKA